jgi:hypothetical protein
MGITLFATTIIRGNTAETCVYSPFLFGLSSNDWSNTSYLCSPRDLRIEVKTESTVDVYIFDEKGLRSWIEKGELEPLWSAEHTHKGLFTSEVYSRGKYTLLVHNPNNSSITIEVIMTFHGLEKDLLWASIILTVTGVCIAMIRVTKQKHTRNHSIVKDAHRRNK